MGKVKQTFTKIAEAVFPETSLKWYAKRRDLEQVKNWSPNAGVGGYGAGGSLAGGNSTRARRDASYNRSYPGTEEYNVGYSLITAQLECMDLYRNSSLAKAIIERTNKYCGQSKPRANTAAYVEDSARQSAEEWDEAATEYFMEYQWKRSDYMRRPGVTHGKLQEFFVNIQFLQGDIAYIWTGDGWMTVEGMRIQTPQALQHEKRVKHGFRYNSKGRATHMYVIDYNEHGGLDWNKFKRYSMQSVIYCPWYYRPGQRRSIPRMHSSITTIRDLEEINENVKVKVKREGQVTTLEKSGSRKKAPGSSFTNEDGTTTTREEGTYGLEFKTSGDPDKDFKFMQPVSPHAEYVPFMKYTGQTATAGQGVPYSFIMATFEGSWSSNKAETADVKKYIYDIWELRRDTLCQPTWNVVITQAIRDGHLEPAPVNKRGYSLFNKVEWSRPYFPEHDTQKEEAGRSQAFQNCTQSLDDWAAERNTTAKELLKNHKRNMMDLKRDAEEADIPFEQYCPSLIAKSSSVSSSAQIQE